MKNLNVLDTKITYYNTNDEDYISLLICLNQKTVNFLFRIG